jgi:predicted HAD superfamily hydrolase
MQTIHADRLESKKEQLRQADELVAGMQEMFEEMTKEVMDATTESEDAMKQMDRLKSKAVSAHAKYIEHKLLANELNDEVRDSSLTQQQLELENEEYKATIEYLYNCLDEQQTVNYACKMFCSHGGMSLACW